MTRTASPWPWLRRGTVCKGIDRARVGGLYFASTTSPYKEKQAAATIAAVLGLPADAVTMDFAGSLRCGTNALKAAADAVDSGAADNILVCAADIRLGYPIGPPRRTSATARPLCWSGGAGRRRGQALRQHVLRDPGFLALGPGHFRPRGRRPFRHGRGIRGRHGRQRRRGAQEVRAGRRRISTDGPELPQHASAAHGVAKKLGFDEKKQVKDVLHASVGDTGCAMSLMSLVAALERAASGEKIMPGRLRQRLRCLHPGNDGQNRVSLETGRGIAGTPGLQEPCSPITTRTCAGANW